MSAPIGPGDYVECIQNRLPTTLPPRGIVVGRIYRVTDTGVTPPDDKEPNKAWLRVDGAECRPDRWGFHAEWFRPVYKPQASLIQSLKQPAPEREQENA